MDYRDALDTVFYHNTVATWGVALLTFVAIVAVLYLARRVVVKRVGRIAAHTGTWADDLLVDLLRGTRIVFLVWLLLQVALKILDFPAGTRELLSHLSFAAFAVQLGLWASRAVTFWLRRYSAERAADGAAVTTIKAMAVALKAVAWIIVGLLVLENLDFDVTTLVAGLGITGIAVALAVQNLLSDLFGALSIVLDKPFVIGDFIVVDTVMGTVEHIGLKTTRLRSLSGEQIIVSNADLLKSRIRNFKRMYERRVVFSVGVSYDTPPERVARIPTIVREAITSQADTRFDRSHFNAYLDSSLNVETVYYVLSPDYNRYMDIQQAVNLELLRRFGEERIDFAYPTRRVVVTGGDGGDGRVAAAGAA
jgi:small-conductance mechanosensitive channel